MALVSIQDAKNLHGKRVLVRFDFNVPTSEGKVADDYRIIRQMPTLEFLRNRGAKIIAISHIGNNRMRSLLPVYSYIRQRISDIEFLPSIEITDNVVSKSKALANGSILLLENVRKNDGEEDNSEDFAKRLARLGDLYVNEAFSTSHRMHASLVLLPQFLPSYVGPLFLSEIKHLNNVERAPKPFIIILGGAKISTKLPIVKKFVARADTIYLYGALAHDVFLSAGFEIGESVYDGRVSVSELVQNKKIVLPSDVVVRTASGARATKRAEEVLPSDTIFDAGPESIARIEKKAREAKYILWNGPLGNYEEGFYEGTEKVAKIIAKCRGFSVVGGDDTIASIQKLALRDKFGFVSTGGGAMLDYLATGTLPGIRALKQETAQRT